MRILLTVHQFFPEFRTGTEVLTLAVARELLRRGHCIEVFTGFPARERLDDARRIDTYQHEDVPVTRYHSGGSPDGAQLPVMYLEFEDPTAALHFSAVVQRFRPDWIHCFHLARLGTGIVEVAAAAGVRIGYTPTDFWSLCPTVQMVLPDGALCTGPRADAGNCIRHFGRMSADRRVATVATLATNALLGTCVRALGRTIAGKPPMLQEALALAARPAAMRRCLERFDSVLAPTRTMAGMLHRHGVPEDRLVHCPYGIDLKAIPMDVLPPNPEGRALRIGFIGTLAPHKGCHILLEAMQLLEPGGTSLSIYGRPDEFPDYVDRLRQHADHLQTRVRFAGTFPISDIHSILEGIDVLVVPSLWYENAPLVVLAALACRRPVIASDVPGMSEVVEHRTNGMLFPAGDAQALAGALSALASMPSEVGRMAALCRRPKDISTYCDELLEQISRGTDRPRPGLPAHDTAATLTRACRGHDR